MTLLRFENMHLAYGHTPLLNDAGLTLEEGERVAIPGKTHEEAHAARTLAR